MAIKKSQKTKQYLAESNHLLGLPSCFFGRYQDAPESKFFIWSITRLEGDSTSVLDCLYNMQAMHQVSWLVTFPQMCNSWKALEICHAAEAYQVGI